MTLDNCKYIRIFHTLALYCICNTYIEKYNIYIRDLKLNARPLTLKKVAHALKLHVETDRSRLLQNPNEVSDI